MTADRAFSDLIGRIYDCAQDTSLWPDVLAEISANLRGSMADLGLMDPLGGTIEWAALHNVPHDVAEKVRAHIHLSPTAPRGLTAPLGEPLCSSREFGLEALHKSPFWQTCFAGRDCHDQIAVPLTRRQSSVGYFGVTGSVERGAFTEQDLEFTRLVAPHIQRSVELSGVLGRRRSEVDALSSAFNTLAAAAIILGADATIRFRNAGADEELQRGALLRERSGRVVGATAEATRLILGLKARGRERCPRDACLTDGAGRVVHATWVALDVAGGDEPAPVLLLLRQPGAELMTPLPIIAEQFGLTPGEMQVLAQLLNGQRLADIASTLRVARSTVKSHVDAIYRKTGTGRQAELVRFVLGFAAPLKRPAPGRCGLARP